MPLGYAELERFYEGLVTRARAQGITCAITSGMLAVKRDARSDAPQLPVQHAARVEHAERLLAQNPLRAYGLERLMAEAREQAARFLPPGSLEWLPDARGSFIGLAP
ncbi:MAG TPA: hypothetical protein VFT34_17705 [Verrucomicrobiae bacterium]|nr:hypothetical protein [Verrucomicrobiae bacterium]